MTQRREIRFAKAQDGAAIAFWDVGSGPPVIMAHNVTMSHVELDWAVPSLASFYSGLARQHRVIRFDPRHCGMSDRRPELAMTTDAIGLDISAVAGACGLDEFSLLGVSPMGPPMIEYAVRFPDRVGYLILCDADVTVAASHHVDYIKGLVALSQIGGSELASSLYLKVVPKDEIEPMSALLSASPSDLDLLGGAVRRWDAAPLLGNVTAPTLIIQSRDSILTSIDEARHLAAGIPGARLAVVEGEFAPYFADQGAVLEAIGELVGSGLRSHAAVGPGAHDAVAESGHGKFKTVVFTDVVSSTESLSRLGDENGRALLRRLEDTTQQLAVAGGGDHVKNTGDGSLVAFSSPSGALSFAAELQRRVADDPIDIRVGMAAGEPIEEHGDLHGAVVVLASRIADEAGAGEVLVSDSVRQLVLGKPFAFAAVGESVLKGFENAVRLWRLEID